MWLLVLLALMAITGVVLLFAWIFRSDPIGLEVIKLIKGDPRGWEELDIFYFRHEESGISIKRKSAGPFAYYRISGPFQREISRPLMCWRLNSALTWLQMWTISEKIDVQSLGEKSLRKESRSVLAQVMADLDEHLALPKPAAGGQSGFADNGRSTKEGIVSSKRIGTLTGKCNREVCRAPNALWFNQSTLSYYCETCATALNRVHTADAQRLYGGPLCVKHAAEAALAQAGVAVPAPTVVDEEDKADEQQSRVSKKKVLKKARARPRTS